MYEPQTKAVLLVRVSDSRQEREGLSLDNQEQVLRSYADGQNFKVVQEFRFQESADLKIRKRFHEMVRFVKNRKDVTCIVAYRVDRMTRNFHDHVLLDDLRLTSEKELHFVHDRLVITPRTVGKDIQDWDTKVFLAKMYLNRLKEDATLSAAFKISRGEWPGKAPFGYINIKIGDRSTIVPDPIRAPAVRRIFALYSSGAHSMESVRALVNRSFDLELSKGKLHFILNNPFYLGEMLFKGKRYPHVYEPLIFSDTFDRVCAVKAGFLKASFKFAGLPFLYRGLIRCSTCGCQITPERKQKPNGKVYHYYHCTEYKGKHDASWVNEDDLTNQFMGLLKRLTIPKEKLAEIVGTLNAGREEKDTAQNTTLNRLQAERTKKMQQLATLYEDRLEGILSKEQYLEKHQATEQRIRDLDRKLKEHSSREDEYLPTVAGLLKLCANVQSVFCEADLGGKRRLLKLLLQNCELNEKRLVWELKSPFDTVLSFSHRPIWLPLTTMFRNQGLELDVNLEDIQAVLDPAHEGVTEEAA